MADDRKLSLELHLEPPLICKHCEQPEGEHAHDGNWCPEGNWFSSTQHFEPTEDA